MKLQKDAEALAKIKMVKSLITSEIDSKFKTCGLIAVDTDFNEVSFDVYQLEFENNKRDFSTDKADFKFTRGDKETYMLYFTYTIK